VSAGVEDASTADCAVVSVSSAGCRQVGLAVSARSSSPNGLIELHCRVPRGFSHLTHYRLRMLLIGGGLSDPRL